MHTMDSLTGILTLLLLYVCYRWSDSADRHSTTRQRLIRAEGRIADLQDQLRCRNADVERLESQVSALTDVLDDEP
jgi:chromosome segregation ATPase